MKTAIQFPVNHVVHICKLGHGSRPKWFDEEFGVTEDE